jgi:oxygen-independent coproporphyrinogen-3 oxidase
LAQISGLYVHVPFCFHKCHYCDFYSIVDSQDRQAAFVDRLIGELTAASQHFGQPLQTIFVGGGTPTLLRVELWKRLLAAIHESVQLERDYEWTVEANPETLTSELVDVLIAGGVNRFSIGCQSFNSVHLKTLERWHDPRNVHRSVEILRVAGVSNFNLDLIFGIPGQSLDEWQADLDNALSLAPSHLSCYSLMYEPNTPLTQKLKAGQIQRIDEDVEAAMYEATVDRLGQAGFEHYEVSNWARVETVSNSDGASQMQNFRCRHNLLYWTNANWWPLGPGAAGHVNGLRWKNVPRLQEYLDLGPLPNIADVERLDADGRVGEELMLGLRLMNGLPISRIESLLQIGTRGASRQEAIHRHVDAGLLQIADDHLRLTRRGLLLADGILADLI